MEPIYAQEAREFAEYFFNIVSSRINNVSDQKRDYTMPKILFVEQRTDEEDKEFHELTDKFEKTAIDLAKQNKLPQGLKNYMDAFNQSLGYNAYALIERLSEKLEKNFQAAYNQAKDTLLLLYEDFENGVDYGLIGHELLHSLRSKSCPIPETNRGYSSLDQFVNRTINRVREIGYNRGQIKELPIPPEVVEFFSLQASIIIEDVCRQSEKYKDATKRSSEVNLLSIDKLVEAHRYFRGTPEVRIVEILDSYEQLIEDAKKAAQGRTSLNTGEIPGYTDFIDKLNFFIENAAYLSLIANLDHYKMKVIRRSLNLLMGSFERLNLDSLIACKPERNISHVVSVLWDVFSMPINLNGTLNLNEEVPYYKAWLAISENIEEIRKEWPKIFLMDASQIITQYINPVMAQIYHLGRPTTIQKVRGKLAKLRLKRLYTKSGKILEEERKESVRLIAESLKTIYEMRQNQ